MNAMKHLPSVVLLLNLRDAILSHSIPAPRLRKGSGFNFENHKMAVQFHIMNTNKS
jgi:hypothetical protein